jgi:hypothetical protein
VTIGVKPGSICRSVHAIFSLLSKNEGRLIISQSVLSVFMSVCPPLTFEPLGRFSWNLVQS